MVSLAQNAALEELAEALYEFLPGSPHPYANPNLSFPAVAQSLRLADCWPSQGNKRQRIRLLLESALQRGRFTDLLKEIVNRSMTYRRITREQVLLLNRLTSRVGFRIPELTDKHFLDSLPFADAKSTAQTYASASLHEQLARLFEDYKELRSLDDQNRRGIAFEKFLSNLFEAFGLEPRGSFRLKGEQIDGSFILASQTYLLEARWRNKPTDAAQLRDFSGKVERKAHWSRGLFVSHSGFSRVGLEDYSIGHPTNIVCMNGNELSTILLNKLNLPEVIASKVRRAAETNRPFVPISELFPNLAT